MNSSIPAVILPPHPPGESRAQLILIRNILPFVIATILTSLRLFVRAVIKRSIWWDDAFLFVSWLGFLSVTLCSTLNTLYGAGKHLDEVPPSQALVGGMLGFANLVSYQLLIGLVKISICLFYMRLFVDNQNRYVIIAFMVWIFVYTTPLVLVFIFQCNPVEGFWDFTLNAKCINAKPTFYIHAGCNMATEILLIGLIAPKIWRMKLEFKVKIWLFLVLTLGWLAIGAAAIRVYRAVYSINILDTTWAFYDFSIWTSVECSTSFSSVCIPVLKPLFIRESGQSSTAMSNSTFGSSNHEKGSTRNSSMAFPAQAA